MSISTILRTSSRGLLALALSAPVPALAQFVPPDQVPEVEPGPPPEPPAPPPEAPPPPLETPPESGPGVLPAEPAPPPPVLPEARATGPAVASPSAAELDSAPSEFGAPASDLTDGVEPGAYPEVGEPYPAQPGDDSRIGWSRDEGFRMRSKDGAYVLRIALQMGLKVEPEWTDGDAQFNSTLAFLRPILRGNFFRPWLGYRLSFEANSGTPRVLDAYFDVQPLDVFGFRFGQQATPVSRHENFGPQQIFFPDFAAVAGYFWSGRERGLTVYGSTLSDRLDYYAGIYAGSPIDEPLNLPKNYVVEARLTVSPLGAVNANELPFTPEGDRLPTRFSFTLQGYQGKLQTAQENFNNANNLLSPAHALTTEKMGTAAADLWFQASHLIAFGEFYYRRIDPRGSGTPAYDSYGAWGQAVLNVYKNLLGLGVRCGWLDPSSDLTNDQSYEVEGQLAYFIHPPELVLKLRYAWLKQKSPDLTNAPESFVLPFVEGKSNLATLQLMMAF